VFFEDIPLFPEAGRRRENAADAGGQTFRHTFESMGWVTVRWHKIKMRVCGLTVEVKLNFPIRECGCGIQKGINVHSRFDGIMERICHIDKIIKAFTTINPLHLNVINET
jgi:hypothetical protein